MERYREFAFYQFIKLLYFVLQYVRLKGFNISKLIFLSLHQTLLWLTSEA